MKVRFNLGRGDNFMKWKLEYDDGRQPEYFDPQKVDIVMHNAVLVNRKTTAKKIHNGSNKTVCAWIQCDGVTIGNNLLGPEEERKEELRYNPREYPYWRCGDEDIDGYRFRKLATSGNKVHNVY